MCINDYGEISVICFTPVNIKIAAQPFIILSILLRILIPFILLCAPHQHHHLHRHHHNHCRRRSPSYFSTHPFLVIRYYNNLQPSQAFKLCIYYITNTLTHTFLFSSLALPIPFPMLFAFKLSRYGIIHTSESIWSCTLSLPPSSPLCVLPFLLEAIFVIAAARRRCC